MTEFKTREQLLAKATTTITAAKFVAGSWTITTLSDSDVKTKTESGLKVYNVGNSFGIYGMDAGLYKLVDIHGNETLAAVPDRSTLLFLLG